MTDKDTLIAICFPLFVAFFAIYQLRTLAKLEKKCKSWLQANGTVTEIKIVGWGRNRSAQVIFEYFTPARYVGSRICPYGCEDRDPKVYLQRYPKGVSIVVYYDPRDPSQSFLEFPTKRMLKRLRALVVVCLSFPFLYLAWIDYLK